MPRRFPLLHEVEAAKEGGELATTPAYAVAYAKDGAELLPGVNTCYELWARTCTHHPNNNALGWREPDAEGAHGPYQYISYAQADQTVAKAAAGLKSLGLSAGDRVGICAINSPEWMMSMQGCNRMSYVAVPLYDTLGDAAVSYIVAHAEARVVLCGASKLMEVSKMATRLKGNPDSKLEALVYWGEADQAAVEAIKGAVPRVMTWQELLAAGASSPAEPQPPQPDDLCTIMYTSGTTGNPKGVMMTHRSVVTEVSAVRQFFFSKAGAKKSEEAMSRYFSFLTLAHIFDRVVEEVFIMQGGCIGYFTGDLRKILDDVAVFKPTAFAGVPRVFDRIYAGALGKVKAQSLVKRLVFRLALAWKGRWIKLGQRPENASWLADLLVFNKFKAALGGQCQAIISGGAPLATHVQEFVQIAMCCPVMQGYGLTETCAASFVTFPWENRQIGTVGPPMPSVQVRLEAVPELGYDPLGRNVQGEVCIRGPAVFKGYYKQPDLTAEVVDEDGFFHTGDIGELTPQGLLKIIDRKKNIFKLSQGEYIAVEKVEAALSRCPLVEQVWVYGNSFESCVVAVAVPFEDKIMAWARDAGMKAEYADVCAAPEARQYVLEALVAAGRAAKLKGFELPKAVFVEPVLFSVDNDLMTPKFSLKRPQLLKRYQKQINEMYSQLKSLTIRVE